MTYVHMDWWEIVVKARPIEAGVSSSAIRMEYGCGHVVYVGNGDAMYHTCPYCYVGKLEKE